MIFDIRILVFVSSCLWCRNVPSPARQRRTARDAPAQCSPRPGLGRVLGLLVWHLPNCANRQQKNNATSDGCVGPVLTLRGSLCICLCQFLPCLPVFFPLHAGHLYPSSISAAARAGDDGGCLLAALPAALLSYILSFLDARSLMVPILVQQFSANAELREPARRSKTL